MSGARVLVVEHQENAGLGLLRAGLIDGGAELEIVGPDTGRPVPASLDGYDALIVLGGAMGPTEDDTSPWLPATRALLAAGVEQRVPTLGVCLGAQLLVTATGGHVHTMPEGPEIGLCSVEFTGAAAGDPLFDALSGTSVPVVQWHYLEAERLPERATLLASSAACAHQAFRVGDAAWGVQFHPEALGQTAVEWVEEDEASLAELGLDGDTVIRGVRDAEPALTEIWSALARRFAAIAASRSPRE